MPVVPGAPGGLPAGPPGFGLPVFAGGGGAPLPGFPPVAGLPGGLGGGAAPAVAVASLGAFGASAAGPGHWLTCAVHGLHCLALGDTGRFIQVVLVDPATGLALATAIVRVDYGHPSDGHGRFFEATWMGSDVPAVDAAWAPLMGMAHHSRSTTSARRRG